MNKFIKEQLDKCQNFVDIEKVSDEEFIIKSKQFNKIELNKYYILNISNSIINSDTLQFNWNNGVKIQSNYIKCFITSIMNDMCKIDGCGFDIANDCDLEDTYIGLWLPISGIDIYKKL